MEKDGGDNSMLKEPKSFFQFGERATPEPKPVRPLIKSWSV